LWKERIFKMPTKLSTKPSNVRRRDARAKIDTELRRIWLDRQTAKGADLTKTRLFYRTGYVATYSDAALAYSVWLSTPKGNGIAFRSAGDATPVYGHDYADR
jgi:hypothetical protein